MLRVRVEV